MENMETAISVILKRKYVCSVSSTPTMLYRIESSGFPLDSTEGVI